jgi:hypothetical protein
LDELDDLSLLSLDSEHRSLAKTRALKQPEGVILDGSDPQVICHLLIGTYCTAVAFDIGRLKAEVDDGDDFQPPFVQDLLNREDLRFVGSVINKDLSDLIRLGLSFNDATLIDTQNINDYRAPRSTYGRSGIAKQSLCVFKSHIKLIKSGSST